MCFFNIRFINIPVLFSEKKSLQNPVWTLFANIILGKNKMYQINGLIGSMVTRGDNSNCREILPTAVPTLKSQS